MRRHEIGDEQWAKIKDLLPGKRGDPGRKTIVCLSTGRCGLRRQGLRGATFPIGSANGIPCSSGSTVGASGVFGNECSRRGKTPIWNA